MLLLLLSSILLKPSRSQCSAGSPSKPWRQASSPHPNSLPLLHLLGGVRVECWGGVGDKHNPTRGGSVWVVALITTMLWGDGVGVGALWGMGLGLINSQMPSVPSMRSAWHKMWCSCFEPCVCFVKLMTETETFRPFKLLSIGGTRRSQKH